MQKGKIRVAVVSWKVREISKEGEFFSHLHELVERCASSGAVLVVLPELFQVELLTMFPDGDPASVPELLTPFSSRLVDELCALAKRLQLTIIGGSLLVRETGGIFNVCPVCYPDGSVQYQPKNISTRWESDAWKVQNKQGIQELKPSNLGVSICYDSEFPESTRALAERGVTVLCVPSYTAGQHGYQRVSWCCRARTVENEIFVLNAALVGPIIKFEMGTAYGRSAIMAPSKEPFPPSATLAETPFNEEAVAIADLDFDALEECRNSGDARPWSDRRLSEWKII